MIDIEGYRLPPTALLVCAILVTAACSTTPTDGNFHDEGARLEAITTGSSAPDFTLETADGKFFSLAETNGRVRLIDFWATWCKPCVEEIPMFKELQQTYGDRGFTVVAISDEPSGVIRDFVESNAVNYPNLIDPGEVSEEYGVLALPSAYLIDREGKIVETFQGPKPRRILESKIVELLGAAGAT